MKKFLILLVFYAVCLSVRADIFENAIKTNNDVILYLYAQDCLSCKKFTPKFYQVLKNHPNIKGIMVDAETDYGRSMIYKYKGKYVPYLILANARKNTTISTYCFLDSICFERAIKELGN